MAEQSLHHMASFGMASVAMLGGVVAQAVPETQVGQIGAGTAAIGATYLMIAFVREVAPHVVNYSKIRADNRDAYIRLEESLRHLREDHDEAKAENARLMAENENIRREAAESKELAIEAKARADELEKRVREVGHEVKNTAQGVANNTQRLDQVEQIVTGSSSGDPEMAI